MSGLLSSIHFYCTYAHLCSIVYTNSWKETRRVNGKSCRTIVLKHSFGTSLRNYWWGARRSSHCWLKQAPKPAASNPIPTLYTGRNTSSYNHHPLFILYSSDFIFMLLCLPSSSLKPSDSRLEDLYTSLTWAQFKLDYQAKISLSSLFPFFL